MLSPSQHSRYTAEESVHDNYSGASLHDRHSTGDMTLKSSPSHGHAGSPPISGYESLRYSDFADEDPYFHTPSSPVMAATATHGSAGKSGEYEGLEGIYKFLQICEEVKR